MPGLFGPRVIGLINRPASQRGLLVGHKPPDAGLEEGNVSALELDPHFLTISARSGRNDGQKRLVKSARDFPERFHRQKKRLVTQGIWRGRNDEQVAARGDFSKLLNAQASVGVDHNVLEVAATPSGLGERDDFKGERPLESPSANASIGIRIDQNGRGFLLKVGRQVNRRRRLADPALVRGHGDDHSGGVYQKSAIPDGESLTVWIWGRLNSGSRRLVRLSARRAVGE